MKKITQVIKPLNPNDNGGESVTLSATMYDVGNDDDPKGMTVVSIAMESYGRTATLDLGELSLDDLIAAVKEIKEKLDYNAKIYFTHIA